MHDLVHDLARSVMVDEFNLAGPNCRYAWHTDFGKPLKSSITSSEKLRALHGHDESWTYQFHRDAVSPAKYVRILHLRHLRGVNSNEFLHSIGQLKQLKYFSAPNISDVMNLGCIDMLRKLNYLDLCGFHKISALPESIGEMEGLMHLDLSGCQSLSKLPHSFAKLKELVYLNLSYCRHVLGITDALADLTKLKHLGLSACKDLRGLPEVISRLTELRYLTLENCMHHIFDSSSIDQAERFVDRICTLPNMEHLDLSFNGNPLISMPESASRLRKLILTGCMQVARIPECVAKMDCQSLFGLLPNFSVTADDTNTNLGILEHINPDELKIDGLENVKSREEARCIKLGEKQRIGELTLWWNHHAKRSVDDMELLRELVPPTPLQKFQIYGYAGVSFPDWVISIENYLPNVVRMYMFHLPNCTSLPPLAQLPNLQVLTLGYMKSLEEWNTEYSSGEDELMFRKLEKVNIHYCPKLRIKPHLPRAASWSIIESDNVLISWAESVSQNGASSSSQVRVSTNLTVEDSEVPLHQWRLLHHLPALSNLHIERCSDLRSSQEITWVLMALKSLTLEKSSESNLPEWLGELTSLQQLVIKRYKRVEELPDSMRQLKQLQSLTLHACRSLRQLTHWLGELTSLQELGIWNCTAITTLPNSIQQLTNLQNLKLNYCSTNLEQWCKAEENKTKLAHIELKFDSPLPSCHSTPSRTEAIPARRHCCSLRWPLLQTKIRK